MKLMRLFNWGLEVKNINQTLYNQLSKSYTDTADVINTKASVFKRNGSPPSDDQFNVQVEEGDLYIDLDASPRDAYICVERTTRTQAVWRQIT